MFRQGFRVRVSLLFHRTDCTSPVEEARQLFLQVPCRITGPSAFPHLLWTEIRDQL